MTIQEHGKLSALAAVEGTGGEKSLERHDAETASQDALKEFDVRRKIANALLRVSAAAPAKKRRVVEP